MWIWPPIRTLLSISMYNFDEIVPRRNTASVKWDLFEEATLPLWVADKDVKA